MPTLSEAFAIAVAHHQAGRLEPAEEIYRRILAADPDHADALHLLGVIAHQRGQHETAVELIGRAVRLGPAEATYHNNLGAARAAAGDLAGAIEAFQQAVRLAPQDANAHTNVAKTLLIQGRPQEAIAVYRRAIRLRPDSAEAHLGLGTASLNSGDVAEAIVSYGRTLTLQPHCAEASCGLGAALASRGDLDGATRCYEEAIRQKPDYAEAHSNLGAAFKSQGKVDLAIACFRRAMELAPDRSDFESNLLYALPFHAAYDACAIHAAHRLWAARHAAPLLQPTTTHVDDRSPNRRVRVGYVSPHMFDHVVGRNLLPLLREHNPQEFEVFVYANTTRRDATREKLRSCAAHWRDIVGLPDGRVAEMIRQERIDILVDLALHMTGNRLLVFARKPAPVQVTFAGYPGTTGLSSIDYRLTDPQLDPPGLDDAWYAEESLRLPDTFWCYASDAGPDTVSALPAAANGFVTFGCLNQFSKVTEPVLRLWARVLLAVERSQLIVLAPDGSRRQETLALLEQQGLAPGRVRFVAVQPRDAYLQVYQQIDVGLDTFPYNGHTTSLDALWMGVPVVTLVGRTTVGRAGLSQLTNLGLSELAAHDTDQYVRIACDLARDLPRLAELRATLRERMQRSPLMDAPRFARNVEAAYREMWRRWCAEAGKGTTDSTNATNNKTGNGGSPSPFV